MQLDLGVAVNVLSFACAVALTERARTGRLALRDNGRWLQGVCTGIATSLGVSVWLVRAAFVTFSVASAPAPVLLYLFLGLDLPWDARETRRWLRYRAWGFCVRVLRRTVA